MKTQLRYAAACAVLSAVPAFAAHAAEGDANAVPLTAQTRLAACSREAKGLKGDEHDKFMSRCLKGPGSEGKPVKEVRSEGSGHSQRNRMKSCNEQAGRKELRGEERRAFMSACLRG